MEIYLPIVQVHIDIITILFISFAVGVLSGLFGVGGGFLMTPFLIFLGIPPVYAVPNEIIKLNFPVSLKKVKVIIPNIVPTTPPIIIISPIL